MSFERLDSIVERVIQRMDIGEAGVAAPALRQKRTPTEAGAKSQGDNVAQGGKPGTGTPFASPPTIGRDRRTGEHPQLGHAPAPLVRRSMLTVISGGRTTEGRKLRRPAFRSSPEGEASKLYVCGGTDHPNLANSPYKAMATPA